MSQLIQLLIGKEIARVKGIDEPSDQFRIGAIAAVVPNPMLGLVLANAIADREAPVANVAGPAKPPSGGESPATGKPDDPATGKSSAMTATPATKSAR